MARIKDGFKTFSYKFNKILIVALSTFFIVLGINMEVPAFAQSGLIVTPTLLELDSRQRYATLTLVNRGTETKTYRITAVNRAMLPDGQFIPVEVPAEGEGFASPYIRFSPRQITLLPSVPQTIRVMLRLPRELENKEYRSHMLFEQVPDAAEAIPISRPSNGLGVQILARFGLSIPIFIRHGDLSASAELDALKAVTHEDGSTAIVLAVKRSGNKSVRGDLVVLQGDQEVGVIRNLAVYLSTDSRLTHIPLDSNLVSPGDLLTVEYRARPIDGGGIIDRKTLTLP